MYLESPESRGMVAAGHPATAEAATEVLRAGGNAFDAAVAAHLAACVAEPVLASLGGGGFLLAAPRDGAPVVYDFFVHSPLCAAPEPLQFSPIHGDFGDATQEFHIGLASIATPGTVAGLEAIHRDLCRLPMVELISPACRLAREGLPLNPFQAYIHRILEPILTSNAEVAAIFAPDDGLLKADALFRVPAMAEGFEALAAEGADWFYHGEPAQRVAATCAQGGGHLRSADFTAYQVIRRRPLARTVGSFEVLTNPVPSVGGSLVMFLLETLRRVLPDGCAYQSAEHLLALAHGMRQTGLARRQSGLAMEADENAADSLFETTYLRDCAAAVRQHALASRGTTHLSVIDAQGNLASMTVTNGEGSGLYLPECGIHLNNMLGEEDLNPRGFHRWHPNRRLSSMMAPTLVRGEDGSLCALGSGGSNRIRTAIAQVLINALLFERGLRAAVEDPRVHLEADLLNLEPGFPAPSLEAVIGAFPGHLSWGETNLFFGGVHAVRRRQGGSEAVADPRRGGHVACA